MHCGECPFSDDFLRPGPNLARMDGSKNACCFHGVQVDNSQQAMNAPLHPVGPLSHVAGSACSKKKKRESSIQGAASSGWLVITPYEIVPRMILEHGVETHP